ncbi:MAG: chromosome segregation protein SMC [Myxococcota bacterium]|nr:chromosome segregation protein SMC [Myxococcota bacterium]
MRIKSLQIQGFKSFVDRASFRFKPGITGIVGPNGCGKSNVVDAIRWAMGEQSPRRLRGKGMEDVIFAGSEARSPVGVAEVVLTFDNSDGVAPPQFASYSEIQVSRRLYRSGESEYLINKTVCRLRDVQDFFRDTGIGTKGYTIVEQGRIAEIVSAKAEERRTLIEEAAGISKYKARRREAERKLEATEQNLTRVTDVVGEIRRQISSLERQAKKAARYKRLRELQRVLELSLASEERLALVAEIGGAEGRLRGLRDAATARETELLERDLRIEERRVELTEKERLVTQGSEVLLQIRSRIKDLENRVAYERRERASLAETNEARGREREQLLGQLAKTDEDRARLADELAQVESALREETDAAARADAEVETARTALRAVEGDRERESSALVEVLTGIARSEDRLAAIDDRSADLDRRLRSADEALSVQQGEADRAAGEQQQLEDGLRNLLAERDRLMGALKEAMESHERARREAREAGEALAARRELREKRSARLASLQEVIDRREDVSEAARHLLGLDEAVARGMGLRGLVRELLEADPEAERAVEAVLGEQADALVVQRTEGALDALQSLRSSGAGRGVLVLEREPELSRSGFVPLGEPLIDRVRPRPGFENVARSLLGEVVLVPALEDVFRHFGSGRLPATFVTPGGDLVTPSGVIRGGGEGSAGGALSRMREVRELVAEVESLDREVESLRNRGETAEASLVAAQDALENLRNRHHTAALAVANHEKDLERTRERVKAIGEAHEGRVAERSAFLSESETLGGDRSRIEAELMSARDARTELQKRIDALGLEVGSAGREVSRLERAAAERRVQQQGRSEVRDRIGAQLDTANATLSETRAWVQQREAEIQTGEERRTALARSIEEAEQALAGQLGEEEGARQGHEARRDAWEQEASALRDLESAARELRVDLESKRDDAQQAELGLREMQLRLEHLDASVRDRWEVDLVQWKPPIAPATEEEPVAEGAPAPESESETVATGAAPEGEATPAVADPTEPAAEEEPDRDAAKEAREIAQLMALDVPARKERLEEIRKRVQAIGEVNLGAIDEHEELRERFRFLSEQKEDLESSVAQLREAIARINRTSRKRFRETFEAVNEKFQKNFPRLFRGGKASLGLTESEDILEAGIEIMAQPPGKRLQSVNLLSGGEKTMTAIALLVAVFQVRPSPFFLLDEVDAALDDANVGRFNEIVKELSESSQFLMITHNKRTIEVSDVLYGVTMEEKGVSKLVSVEIH